MRVLSLFTIFAIFGCTGLFAVEGANPGECADDADNDGDGLFDCDDTDCVLASSCSTPIGDSDADTDADSDADSDADADGDPTFDVSWNSSGMTLSIGGGSGGYLLGMIEATDNGWYGEDCLDGPGPNSGDYDICHDDVSKGGISLETVNRPQDVEANSSTLMSDTTYEAGHLVYMVYTDSGDCWTWGDDTSYYVEQVDCTEY